MSTTESAVPNKGKAVEGNSFQSFSLNEIIKNSMRKLQAHHPGPSLVLRCEELPETVGNRQELTELFEQLILLILSQKPNGSRLFLYIDCAAANASNEEEEKGILLRFNTNISTDEHWKLVHSQTLAQCKMIVSNNHGSLQVNQITGTGCLFSVSLPGKSE